MKRAISGGSGWLTQSAGERPEGRRLRAGSSRGHVTPKRVLYSNFGCCIGTRRKSETYKISGAGG